MRHHVLRRVSHRGLSTGVSAGVGAHIRRAQAVEVFRAEFFRHAPKGSVGDGLSVSVSASDLDDLVVATRVRPSLFVGPFEAAGKVLGFASSLAPSSCASLIGQVVDDVAKQSFNDSIRELQQQPNVSEDVKETLKYHRDLRSSSSSSSSSSSDDAPAAAAASSSASTAAGENVQVGMQAMATQGLLKIFRITDVV